MDEHGHGARLSADLLILKRRFHIEQTKQVLGVVVVVLAGQCPKLMGLNEAFVEGDFFNAGDFQSLAFFDGLHEIRRL